MYKYSGLVVIHATVHKYSIQLQLTNERCGFETMNDHAIQCLVMFVLYTVLVKDMLYKQLFLILGNKM